MSAKDHARMTAPNRIQLRRTKGWRKPPAVLKVDRTTRWGNPHRVGEPCPAPACGGVVHDQAGAVEAYRQHEVNRLPVHELTGRVLACWCRPDQPCHADVLLELANAGEAPASVRAG